MDVRHAELRDELLATIAAAPELSREEREHLADVFLDRLDAEYVLVERGAANRNGARPVQPRNFGFPSLPPIAVAAIVAVAGFMLVAMLAMSATVHHPPVFLIPVLFFLAMRFFVWGPRRRMHRW